MPFKAFENSPGPQQPPPLSLTHAPAAVPKCSVMSIRPSDLPSVAFSLSLSHLYRRYLRVCVRALCVCVCVCWSAQDREGGREMQHPLCFTFVSVFSTCVCVCVYVRDGGLSVFYAPIFIISSLSLSLSLSLAVRFRTDVCALSSTPLDLSHTQVGRSARRRH